MVNFTQNLRYKAYVIRFTNLLGWNWLPGYETGNQIAFRSDEIKYFRSDAQFAGSQVGGVFNLPVYSQEFCICPGDSKNKRLSTNVYA